MFVVRREQCTVPGFLLSKEGDTPVRYPMFCAVVHVVIWKWASEALEEIPSGAVWRKRGRDE